MPEGLEGPTPKGAETFVAGQDNPFAEKEPATPEVSRPAAEAVERLQESVGNAIRTHEVRRAEDGGVELVFTMEEVGAPRIVLAVPEGEPGRYNTGQIRVDVAQNRGLEDPFQRGIDPLLGELAGEKVEGVSSDESGEVTVKLSSGMRIVFPAMDTRAERPILTSKRI